MKKWYFRSLINICTEEHINIYNALLAIIFLFEEEIPYIQIKEVLETVDAPRGRMEVIPYNDKSIIIDYAHTPDAVENVLKAINEIATGDIITIVGCGGDRDRVKRSLMSKIACENSNYVILTDDNPRSEDPGEIMIDMTKDLITKNFEIIHNREDAIKKGISKLKGNGVLMVLGKGHESYQIIGNKRHHFDDKEIALKYINIQK